MLDATLLRDSWRHWWSPTWYRGSVGPSWLTWVWTFVFNSAIAAALTLIGWGASRNLDLGAAAVANFVVAQCIGFSIHILFRLGLRLLGPERLDAFTLRQRALFYVGVPILGVLIGYALGLSLLGVDVQRLVFESPRVLLQIIFFSVLLSAFWYRYMANKARLGRAEAEREQERVRALAADKQLLDAQLRALQAQIEPHFLFNTLANVASLIDTAPDKARLMLARLIELLRGSLAASRSAQVDVGRELDLVRAYLDIVAIRMGARLHYSIDVPAELRGHPLPPLLIQPLVENAIRHGLEPKLQGGSVKISVRAESASLLIEVADDGLGFAPATRSGLGLSNLRERLAALYGDGARLTIEDAQPGTRVRVALPRQQ
ncbi:MAG TPA: histidine kinase [Burkholderiaceae bacterium]|nr:histidine kinase [Burkholderiaceae bacterium]